MAASARARSPFHAVCHGSSPESARVRIAPVSRPVSNPAFDVTPARLVTGLITERGVCAASEPALRRLLRPEHDERTPVRGLA